MNESDREKQRLRQLNKLTPFEVRVIENPGHKAEKNKFRNFCYKCGLNITPLDGFFVCPRCNCCVNCKMVSFKNDYCSACSNGRIE